MLPVLNHLNLKIYAGINIFTGDYPYNKCS